MMMILMIMTMMITMMIPVLDSVDSGRKVRTQKIKLEQVWALGGPQVRKSVCNKISTKKKNNEWYGSCIFCLENLISH